MEGVSQNRTRSNASDTLASPTNCAANFFEFDLTGSLACTGEPSVRATRERAEHREDSTKHAVPRRRAARAYVRQMARRLDVVVDMKLALGGLSAVPLE
jgi:hypothetical protein